MWLPRPIRIPRETRTNLAQPVRHRLNSASGAKAQVEAAARGRGAAGAVVERAARRRRTRQRLTRLADRQTAAAGVDQP